MRWTIVTQQAYEWWAAETHDDDAELRIAVLSWILELQDAGRNRGWQESDERVLDVAVIAHSGLEHEREDAGAVAVGIAPHFRAQ